jgi:hypothetical protein
MKYSETQGGELALSHRSQVYETENLAEVAHITKQNTFLALANIGAQLELLRAELRGEK